MLTKSKIPLIVLAQDWADARSLDIPDYQIVTLLSFYWYLFLSLLLTRAEQLIAGVFHLDICFICWFKVFCCSSVHSGILMAEKGDGVGGKGLEDITMVETETLLEVFLGTSTKL
jgi:hypothetical protein